MSMLNIIQRSALTLLIVRENFSVFIGHESFKLYLLFFFTSWCRQSSMFRLHSVSSNAIVGLIIILAYTVESELLLLLLQA
jgi:hypothetical protein